MVVLLLYAYCVGLPSSRKIEKACWDDAAFRVLTGNQQPDHSRISHFRRRQLSALAGLYVQVLRLCQRAGLLSLGQVGLDGTNVKADASKHKAMSHERMLKSERQLEAEMRALLRKAEIIDAQEDGQYGKGKRGDELPEELQRRSSRLEWIRKAKAELVAEAATAKAAQRNDEAEASEQDAEASVASGDEQRCNRAARRLIYERVVNHGSTRAPNCTTLSQWPRHKTVQNARLPVWVITQQDFAIIRLIANK